MTYLKQKRQTLGLAAVLAFALPGLPLSSVTAQTIYDGATNGDAAVAGNWTNGLPVATGTNAEALFDGATAGTLNLTLGANLGVRNVGNDDGSFFRFTGNQTDPVTISASGASRDINVRSSTTTAVFQMDAGAGAVTIGGGAQPIRFLVGNGTGLKTTRFTNESSSLATFTSNVSFLSGGGRSQDYLFTGGGTGGFDIAGPLVVNQAANDAAYTASVNVNMTNGGQLALSGDNSGMTGPITMNAGVLRIGGADAIGTGAIDLRGNTAADAVVRSDGTDRIFANQVTLSVNGTLGGGAGTGNLTFGDLLRGSSPSEKTLVVDGITSTFTGVVTSANGILTKDGDGTLSLLADSAATWTSGTLRHRGGTLALGHNDAAGGSNVTIDIAGSGTGSQRIISSDGSARTLANDVTLGTSASFGNDSTGNLVFTGDWNGGGAAKTITVDTIDMEIQGELAGSGGRVKNGDGRLILSGDSSAAGMTGGWTVADGALRVTNPGALGGAANTLITGGGSADGVLELDGGVAIDQGLTVAGRTSSAVALRNVSGSNTVNNVITMGAGGADYNISSDAGTLTLAGGVDAPASGAATRNLNLSGAGDINASGAIADVGTNPISVLKTGTGTLTLGAANTFSAGFETQGGTVVVGNDAALGTGTVDLRASASDAVTLRSDGNARTLGNAVTFSSSASSSTVLGGAGTGDLTFTGDWNAGSIGKTLTVDTITADLQGNFNKTTSALTKDGDGTLIFSGNASNFGQTLNVDAGTVRIDGTLGSTGSGDVSVANGAILGGDGTIAGDLFMAAGAQILFNALQTLDVSGVVTLDNSFGIGDLIGLDNTVAEGTYTILGTTASDFSNIQNFGSANAFDLGGGKSAYFQNGSLQLIVVPEPGSFGLIGGSLALFWVMVRRRKVKA